MLRWGMTKAEQRAQLRNDIACKLADVLGDMLKHDNDYADAVELLEVALTQEHVLDDVRTLVAASTVTPP